MIRLSMHCMDCVKYVLHVEEGMEEGVYELSRHLHESWQVCLQSGIDIIILVGRYLKILFKLL